MANDADRLLALIGRHRRLAYIQITLSILVFWLTITPAQSLVEMLDASKSLALEELEITDGLIHAERQSDLTAAERWITETADQERVTVRQLRDINDGYYAVTTAVVRDCMNVQSDTAAAKEYQLEQLYIYSQYDTTVYFVPSGERRKSVGELVQFLIESDYWTCVARAFREFGNRPNLDERYAADDWVVPFVFSTLINPTDFKYQGRRYEQGPEGGLVPTEELKRALNGYDMSGSSLLLDYERYIRPVLWEITNYDRINSALSAANSDDGQLLRPAAASLLGGVFVALEERIGGRQEPTAAQQEALREIYEKRSDLAWKISSFLSDREFADHLTLSYADQLDQPRLPVPFLQTEIPLWSAVMFLPLAMLMFAFQLLTNAAVIIQVVDDYRGERVWTDWLWIQTGARSMWERSTAWFLVVIGSLVVPVASAVFFSSQQSNPWWWPWAIMVSILHVILLIRLAPLGLSYLGKMSSIVLIEDGGMNHP